MKNVSVCQRRLDVSGDADGNSSPETNYIAAAPLFSLCLLCGDPVGGGRGGLGGCGSELPVYVIQEEVHEI